MTPLRLLAGGAALLLAAVLSWAGLAVAQVDVRWGAAIPVDGAPHVVELDSDRTAMLWAYDADATPTCTAGAASGEVVEVRPGDGSYRRSGGSAGDWVGVATFDPRTAAVAVTCTLDDGRGTEGIVVLVETAPVLPPLFAALGRWGAVPAGLGSAGLLAVAAGACLAGSPWTPWSRTHASGSRRTGRSRSPDSRA